MTEPVPISVFLGTKAQLIKMAPVMVEFDRRDWHYRILDTGQHTGLIADILREFDVREPDVLLYENQGRGISTLTGGCRWLASLSTRYLPRASYIKRHLFGGTSGISLVHGDTMSTLIATLIAKRGGQKVAHIEAGLRSWKYVDPFPEEIVRVAVMRMADYLFAPSTDAMANLHRMSLSTRAFLLPNNTALDTVAHDLRRSPRALPQLPESYSLATVHRLETIYRKPMMRKIVDILLAAHRRHPLVFVQHPATMHRLHAFDLERVLSAAGVIQIPLLDHVSFLHLLYGASFVLTDGGSVQEEASYLGTPCLVLRRTVERSEGFGENVVLSRMNDRTISDFLQNFSRWRRPSQIDTAFSPSAAIADYLIDIRNTLQF